MNLHGPETLLRTWIGLDAATIGPAALRRAVRARMDALGLSDPDAFTRLLTSDDAERDRLVEEVIVAESWFFRDRQVFDFVADVAVTIATLPGRAPVRVLSAPCASGEEPYSVAMALLDAGLVPGQFTIDAVDVSRAALERARLGRYSANAFRNADTSFRDRWFRMDGGAATIDGQVRSCVRFEWANMLEAGFTAGRGPYDVVFCRNLLIYLGDEARGSVERLIDSLLAPDGILVLGAAEPPIMKGNWIPAGAASVFALRRGIHRPRSAVATAPAPRRPKQPPAASVSRPPTVKPQVGGTLQPTAVPRSLEEILAATGALANAGRHAEALDFCERHRLTVPPAPELFFLMGMLHQSLGDLDRAEGCFHKTLYLDSTHEEALLSLALLARRRGDERMAETYRQSAARVLARKAAP